MRALVVLSLALATIVAPQARAEPRPPSAYVAAIADQHRPDRDRAMDAARKPAEILAFAGVKPGDRVAEVVAGGGYFTRLFSSAVGARGAVYALEPPEINKLRPEWLKALNAVIADPVYSNVTVVTDPLAQAVNQTPPEPLDLVFIRQNYHDLHDRFMGPIDVPAFNKAVFKAPKPGGVYVVLDHASAAGSGLSTTDTLHRIDPIAVKAEVTAAGFVLDGESALLRNPADPKTAAVFDPSINGKTDQFLLRFKKPMK